ncbi:MAG: tRNA-dihydrouridine synthase family protein [Lachnospiraceae bacterium]|nr:tRNA-dihydrouridine synthase family protein [Lachnospiraceae bacterium]
MKLYFAPLEGIGGYLYRNAQADHFPKADKYFSPFLSPGAKKRLTPRDLKDVAPEHNEKICLVPQVMANQAKVFVETVLELRELGYGEVNLNLGCPSRTVVSKGRGAGFLGDPEELESFFDETFKSLGAVGEDVRISVKTRIGMRDPREFERLLKVYDQYPISELIIHPRVQADYYKNHPNMEAFAYALTHTKIPIAYNGDLFSVTAFLRFHSDFPDVASVMIGRGVLSDPALFGEIRTALGDPSLTREAEEESALTNAALLAFHDRLLADYEENLSGEKVVLFKMKELWSYMIFVFPDSAKYGKAIRKAQHLPDYREAVDRLFSERNVQESSLK